MAPAELFSQLSLWMGKLCLNFTPFASILSYFYMCGSGSVMGIPNTDPVPQSSWIRIQFLRMRIHNTGQEILVADSNSHNYPKSANSRLGECKSLEIPILLMTPCLTFCHCFPLTWFLILVFCLSCSGYDSSRYTDRDLQSDAATL